MKKGFLKELLRSPKTVYSFKELVLLWPDTDLKTIKSRVAYYVKQGELYHVRRGLYAINDKYNRLEAATMIVTPSYISFETVLANAGITFQYYSQIFVASYVSRTIECDGQKYTYKKIKPLLLTDSKGIQIKNAYSIATPERAFLDTIYIYRRYYFDNLLPLNWDKVYELLPIYNNKSMEKTVRAYHERLKKEL